MFCELIKCCKIILAQKIDYLMIVCELGPRFFDTVG